MAEPRTDWGKELLDKLDMLTTEFRAFREMSKGYFTVIDIVKWLATACLLGAIGGVLYVNASIAATNATISQYEKSFARLDKSITDLSTGFASHKQEIHGELAKQGRDISKLEVVIETLAKENRKLAVLIEKKTVHLASVKVFYGTMLSMKGETLEFMSPDKTQMTFTIKDAKIFINGKEATLVELHELKFAPAYIYLTEDDHSVFRVEAEKRKGK